MMVYGFASGRRFYGPWLGVLAFVAVAGSAQAQTAPFSGCGKAGCAFTYEPDPDHSYGNDTPFDFDYTVPTDGRLHLWTFRFTSADPNASLALQSPSQLDAITTTRTADGPEDSFDSNGPPFLFSTASKPGAFTVAVKGPRAYDYCSSRSGPVGQVCGRYMEIYGNGTVLTVSSLSTVNGVFTENVPEPASWALLMTGFAAVGTALRQRRRSLA